MSVSEAWVHLQCYLYEGTQEIVLLLLLKMLFRIHNCLKLNRNKYILISCLVLDEFIIASVSDIIVMSIERTFYAPEKTGLVLTN